MLEGKEEGELRESGGRLIERGEEEGEEAGR